MPIHLDLPDLARSLLDLHELKADARRGAKQARTNATQAARQNDLPSVVVDAYQVAAENAELKIARVDAEYEEAKAEFLARRGQP
jgi:hypothetical protein